MTKNQQQKLSEHLRDLANKLAEKDANWKDCIIDSLYDISLTLELTSEEE